MNPKKRPDPSCFTINTHYSIYSDSYKREFKEGCCCIITTGNGNKFTCEIIEFLTEDELTVQIYESAPVKIKINTSQITEIIPDDCDD